MPVSFDSINKWILITAPTTSIGALEIYSRTMEWCATQPDIVFEPPMKAMGKFGMGGGVFSDIIYILQFGWKIKPWSGTYLLTISGTVITDDETPRTVLPDFGNVEVVFQVCSQGTIEEGGGPGPSTPKVPMEID